jgi:hypothetical protein
MNRDVARCADLCFKVDCDRNLIHVETGKVYNFSSFEQDCPDYAPLLDFSNFTTGEMLRLIEPKLKESKDFSKVGIDHYMMFALINRLERTDPKTYTLYEKKTYEKMLEWLGLSLSNLPWITSASGF